MTTEAQRRGLGEFARRGFTLEHPDDHIVLLMHEGELVGRFSQTGATEKSIQRECANHLALRHHRNDCLWTRNEDGNQGK